LIAATYLIGQREYSEAGADFQEALAFAYTANIRPRCKCLPEGVEMYVARYGDSYVIKRMPGTAMAHHPLCDAFDVEGEVGASDAVTESAQGHFQIRCAFPLDRYPARAQVPHSAGIAASDVERQREGLSLEGLAKFMLRTAKLNHWSPKAGKRPWSVVARQLTAVAEASEIKGEPLIQRVLIPEPFDRQRAEANKARIDRLLETLRAHQASGVRKLHVLVGELKEFEEENGVGYRGVVKQMPDHLLAMDPRFGGRFYRKFETFLTARRSDPDKTKLLISATFSAGEGPTLVVEAASLLMTTEQWIPVTNLFEKIVVDTLIEQKRSFVRTLSYAGVPVSAPNFLLLDSGEKPIAMDILLPAGNRNEREAKESAINQRSPSGWVWRTAEVLELPKLPPPAVRAEGSTSQLALSS
jgi:hypothetical protein